MNKPSECKDIYYSNAHKYMLYAAAEKTLKNTHFGTLVDLDDLVNAGWLRCLRRRSKEKLKGCFTILHKCMQNNWFELMEDHSVFIHKKYFDRVTHTSIEEIENPEEYQILHISNNSDADIALEIDNIFSLNINPKYLEVLKCVYLEEKENNEVAIAIKCPLHNVPLLKWEAIVAVQQALHIDVKGIK